MPPRLNKRQQRELEELEALGGSSNAHIQNSSEDEAPMNIKPGTASFSNVSNPQFSDFSDWLKSF